MFAYQRYGIAVNQRYTPADGSSGTLLVLDVETHAHCDDIVVRNTTTDQEYRIDAFKLAMCRYRLVSE